MLIISSNTDKIIYKENNIYFPSSKDLINYIYNSSFKERLLNTPILINNYEIIPNIFNNKIIYNLENLSLKDEFTFLANFKNESNLYFFDKYNTIKERSIEELKNTYTLLYKAYKYIKENNLSIVEEIYLVYELIKKRKPLRGNNDDEGRDLCEVIKERSIVCLGYSNLMASLLELLDIPNEILEWNYNKTEYGHTSNIVYINDPKYRIEGLYSFDLAYNIFFIPIKEDIINKNKHNFYLIPGSIYYYKKDNLNNLENNYLNSDILDIIKKRLPK